MTEREEEHGGELTHTDHHEKLQCDTPAEPQQREGADGDCGDGLASPQELQLKGDGSMQVHTGVILRQLHKDCPAPVEGRRAAQGTGTTPTLGFGATVL